jgi:DNA-binding IclR family transcriptional regulator
VSATAASPSRRRQIRPGRGAITRGRLTRELLLAIRLLSRGRHLVADLAEATGLERRAAYRLLAALRDVGLRVERHREGPRVYLRLPRVEVSDWLWVRPIDAVRRR